VPVPAPAALATAVRRARRRGPVLVILHAGRELDPEPAPRDHAYAEAAAGAGAAAVVFHGARAVRPLVRLHGVPVHYGLGNLLFDQRDPRACTGQVVTLRVGPRGPAAVLALDCVGSLAGAAVPCAGPTGDGSPRDAE
jgi:poly-gamma-glutamate capsule biosynthesis protein CapA/YwtB (metallophosphatase superfamily)